MNKNYIAAVVLSVLFLTEYASGDFKVNVLKKDKLLCHKDTVYNSKGKPSNCEVSGVAYSNGMLYFMTDWWDINNNNFFAYKWDGYSSISGVAEEIQQTTINSS